MTVAGSARRGFVVLAAGNLMGKAVAIGREIVFASAFGTGPTASGFRVAQSLSSVPANLVASDVLSAAFAPSYARALEADASRAAGMLRSYALVVGCLLTVISVGFGLIAPLAVDLTIPGASAQTKDVATEFLTVLVWTVPLYGVSVVFALGLAANGRYFSQSVRPLIQSAGLLIGTLLAVLTGWVGWLAVAFVLAWVVYCGLTFSACRTRRLFRGAEAWRLSRTAAFLRADVRRAAPLLIVPVLIQLSIVLERTFASLGPSELLAGVDYARTVSDSVMSLVAVPLGLLGLTRLATISGVDLDRTVRRLVEVILAALIPASMMLVTLAVPIVGILYERGSFSARDTEVTAQVLVGHAAFLFAQVLGYVLSRALVAQGRTTVVVMGTAAALAAQVLTQALVTTKLGPMAVGLGPSVYGVVMSLAFLLSLGMVRPAARALLIQSPVLAVGFYAAFAIDTTAYRWAATVVIVVVWTTLAICVRPLRDIVRREFASPVRQILSRSSG